MRYPILALLLAGLMAAPAAAETSPAFTEARDFIVAGKVGNALLVIGVGAMGINDQDDTGYTLLHYAVKSGLTESVTELLRSGADPKIRANDGSTPLTLAADPAIRALLASAAGQDTEPPHGTTK